MRSFTTNARRSFSRPLLWFFVVATVVKVWLGPSQGIPVASAQIPDSGAQRNRLIQELRTSNELLRQIHNTLVSGTIKVRMEGAEKAVDKTKGRKRR